MADKDKLNGTPPTPTPAPGSDAPTPPDKPKANPLVGRVREAIKGLKFRTNKKIHVEGEPIRNVPDERQMSMGDVLSSAEVNGTLVIVSADGRKHRVAG